LEVDKMRVTRVIANLRVADMAKAREFYTDYLGLSAEGLDLGWVVRLSTPDGKAVVQLVTRDATAAEDPVVSVAVGADVDQVCSAGSSEWPTMLITNQKPNSQHSGSSSPAYSLTRPTATRRLLPISSRER
jgi:hypothetical protein